VKQAEVAARFAASAAHGGAVVGSLERFHTWWEGLPRSGAYAVEPVPFAALEQWGFAPRTGDLVHATGGFFSIEGVRVHPGGGADPWTRPIIHQPEIGILGILVQEFDGVLHCLMQAKFEPGNVNVRQLSPTVQATRSNYTRLHEGRSTPYAEYFRDPGAGRVLVDVLQSEQGGWFWRKHNRNIVVEVPPGTDVPVREGFCWLTLGQIRALLRTDDLVNMDARTVLACMPVEPVGDAEAPGADPFTAAVRRSTAARGDDPRARTSLGAVISRLTDAKARCLWKTERVPLAEVDGWECGADAISGGPDTDFRIVGVRVGARHREVGRWYQPLLEPTDVGLAAFVVRVFDGVLHVLVCARPEPGLLDLVEMAPTAQGRTRGGAAASAGPFADLALTDDPARVRFDTVLSEEGGRFRHARTRYRVVDAGADAPEDPPEGFCWVTVGQLMDLVRHAHYLNIEARTLLACLHTLG
jgi:oxidase EvaA